ncbi:MAG: hypothetical protein KF687_07975 [Cyclobacteriaceae bacterium]|nr:hypothetical protein [Cyclobacteriaceae bacterium]
MRAPIVTFAILVASVAATAQIFPVDTLFKNGELQERINLVFLSDGYKSDELGK